jgi:radical SAM superfamily enzyme YgiQ (UPF0313 family)
MKTALILSFDLIREGELPKSLAVASLLAYLKQDARYGSEFTAESKSVNMWYYRNSISNEFLWHLLEELDLHRYDTLAISCYIWNEYFIKDFLQVIRRSGFQGKIVLGGYQISYTSKPEQLFDEYPEADIYIKGYAEKSLLEAILMPRPAEKKILKGEVDFSLIPSVYLTGEFPIEQNMKMIRWETQRGCPYVCSFCAHRDLEKGKVYKHELDKIFAELAFFKGKNVQKVNALDPIFNGGKNAVLILEEIARLQMNTLFSFQVRFENFKNVLGKKFLDFAEKININLEFGLQTIVEKEFYTIERPNNLQVVESVIQELNERGISYEISMIYGLPHQTLESFQYGIDWLLERNVKNIAAFPLMLLKGTKLYDQKEEFSFVEKVLGDFNIPTVVSSNTFSENEWQIMKEIAGELNPKVRF